MNYVDNFLTVDRLFIKQKITPFVNKYRVFTVEPDGKSPGQQVAFVQQKRLKLKEEINFFADENQNYPILQIKKRSVLELKGTADVKLPDGTIIGQLRKSFGKSLVRSTWEILDPAGNLIAIAHEKSMGMAVLRRLWGFIPVIGEVPYFIPFHFNILINNVVVGQYTRPMGLSDRYLLDLSGDPYRYIDRRVALALTIALDALQAR